MATNATHAPVAIVGAGPVGLALALARHGIRSVGLERKPATSERSKAPALTSARARRCAIGASRRASSRPARCCATLTVHAADGGRPLLSIDFSELEPEADRPGLLLLEQSHTERLLLEAVCESGLCDVRFGADVVALERGESGARMTYREAGGRERTVDAELVAGCDGAGSFVRDALGLSFDGRTYASSVTSQRRPPLILSLAATADSATAPRACSVHRPWIGQCITPAERAHFTEIVRSMHHARRACSVHP